MAAAGQEGATVSITLFALAVNAGILLWPTIVRMTGQRLSANPYLDVVYRDALYIVGVFMLMQTAQIVFSIGRQFAVNTATQLVLYMTLFGWGGYLLMLILLLRMILSLLEIWKGAKQAKRYGYE